MVSLADCPEHRGIISEKRPTRELQNDSVLRGAAGEVRSYSQRGRDESRDKETRPRTKERKREGERGREKREHTLRMKSVSVAHAPPDTILILSIVS